VYIEIASKDGWEGLRDTAGRYLRVATGPWKMTDPDRLEVGLRGLGVAGQVEDSEDGIMRVCVMPLAQADADEAEAA